MKATRILLALALASGAAPLAAQESANCISGTVSVAAPLAAAIPKGGTLFVYAHEAGRKEGPPTAVVSIRDPAYPQAFRLCGEDQMVKAAPARKLSGRYRVTARHSPTGEPMKQEGFLGAAEAPAGGTVALAIERRL